MTRPSRGNPNRESGRQITQGTSLARRGILHFTPGRTMNLRLTSRIVLFFMLLAAALLATVGVLSYLSASKSLKDAAISEMLAAAIEKEAALDTWIEERLAHLGQIANQADVVEKAANLLAAAPTSEQARSARAILRQEFGAPLTSHRSGFTELFVMEPEGGKVVASTSPAEEGKVKLGHPYFDHAKTQLFLQAPYHSADMAAPGMTAATPLRATDGRVVAVLAVRMDLAALNTIAQRRTGLRQTDDSFLFNAEQFPVTQPRFINEPVVLRRKLDTEAIRLGAARHSGVTLALDYRGVPSIAVYRWNAKQQLGLIVKIDQAEAFASARALGWSLVLISGLALLATLGISFLLARTITQPLRALHSSVRRFGDGNTAEAFPESSDDEIGLLAGEFNQMASRVGERNAEIARVNEALNAENAERQRVELEIQHQAAFARFNPNPVLELSAAGEINYSNDAAGEMARGLGLENPAQMLPPNTAAMVGECLDTGGPKARVKTQIGPCVISWSFFPISFNNTVHCYAGDITARTKAEEALRESEDRYRSLVEESPDAIGIYQEGNLVFINFTGARQLGAKTKEELVGRKSEKVIHPDDLPNAMDRLRRRLAGEPGMYPAEVRYVRLDGTIVPVEVAATPIIFGGKPAVQFIARDITERKQAEEELRASQQFIEGILNAMPVRVFWKDRNLVYLGCNAAFARDAGFADSKDIIGKDDYQMGWRDQAELYRGDDRAVIESGCSKLLIEEPQTTPEGNAITLLSSKIPLRGANGEVTGVLGMYLDITERKQAEEVLRQRVKLQDQLVRTAATVPGMIYSLVMRPDGSTRMPYASGALSDIFDLQPQDVIEDAAPVFALIHPDDIGHLQATMAESARTLNPWRDDFRLCRTRLGEIWVEGHSVPTREPDGSILWHGFVQDITRRKETELASMRLAAIIDSSDDAILSNDLNSISTSWNRGAEKLFGYTASEIVGTSIMRLLPADRQEEENQILEKIARGESAGQFETLRQHKDGRLLEVSVVASPIKDATGKVIGVSKIARDITERKRAQVELQDLQKQLVEASRQAGMAEIATSVLHNVGNVLNSINVSTGLVVASVKQSRASSLARVVLLLQEHAADLGTFITQDSRGKHVPAHLAQLAEHLQAEQDTNVRELELLRRNVDHVKEIVAMQQNHATFVGVKEMINVVHLVEDGLRINAGALSRHEVAVVREFEDVPPLNGEKHNILQILVNLLRNAKHACQDSRRADKQMTVRVANGDGRVRISVIDNGVGIPPENLTRIFHYGFTTRKGGHGFGLHSGALAAKEMGGSLTAHSDGPGQGASFTLELPLPNSGESP
jgi:PAS domain S-box-containing protein